MSHSKLTVNAKKTKQMLALRNNNYPGDVESLVVKMSNTALANVSTYKYLGAKLWDMLAGEVQRATTKVRFKGLIA